MIPTPPRPDLHPEHPADTHGANGTRPVSTWRWWELLAVVLGGFLLGSIAATPVYALLRDTRQGGASGVSELSQAIVIDVVLVLVLVFWLSRRHPGWRAAIGFAAVGRRLREAAIGAGLGLLVLLVATLASWLILAVLRSISHGAERALPRQVRSDLSPGAFAVFAVLALIVAPVAEELVFRGLLFRSLRDRHSFILAAIVSALFFGLVHFVQADDWQGTVALQATMVFTGFGLAAIYERRGNLLANIAGHVAFNSVAVVTMGIQLVHR